MPTRKPTESRRAALQKGEFCTAFRLNTKLTVGLIVGRPDHAVLGADALPAAKPVRPLAHNPCSLLSPHEVVVVGRELTHDVTSDVPPIDESFEDAKESPIKRHAEL